MRGTRVGVWICLPLAVLPLLASSPLLVLFAVGAVQGTLGKPDPWGSGMLAIALVAFVGSVAWLIGAWFTLRDRQSSWIAHIMLVVAAIPAAIAFASNL